MKKDCRVFWATNICLSPLGIRKNLPPLFVTNCLNYDSYNIYLRAMGEYLRRWHSMVSHGTLRRMHRSFGLSVCLCIHSGLDYYFPRNV